MEPIIGYLFGAASFIPHGYCLLWRPDLVALHAAGDGLTALAYFLIPAAILQFLRQRHDLAAEHYHIAGLFAAFILACALSHVAGLVTLWQPYYGLQGLIKVATAAISLITAVLIWRLMPSLLALPSPKDLAVANARLTAEIAAKEEALAALRAARDGLERTVAERTRELLRANQRFELALANSDITMFQQDEELRYVWVYNPALGMAEEQVIGKTDAELLPAAGADQVSTIKRAVIKDGERRAQEIRLSLPHGEHWYDLRVEPVASGLEKGVICVAIDITRRKEIEERLKLVMHELAHRVKNIFAVVQSIMIQTARRSEHIADFKSAFSDRLLALSRGHDQLIKNEWRSASLRGVIGAIVNPLLGGEAGDSSSKLQIVGPELALESDQVQNFALAFHELTTNSLKYGAFSTDAGRVTVSWRVVESAGERSLELVWSESGGPAVSPPQRQGFGRLMTETLVPRSLGGTAELDFAATGLIWRLTVSLRVHHPPPIGAPSP